MSKNTYVTSEIDSIVTALRRMAIPYSLNVIGIVKAEGENDKYEEVSTYEIRRLEYGGHTIVLEQMARCSGFDKDDVLISRTFDIDKEPKDWPLEIKAKV